MKTIEDLIKKLLKTPALNHYTFKNFNAKTEDEKKNLDKLIFEAIRKGYVEKSSGNVLKVTNEGRRYINGFEGKENLVKIKNEIFSVEENDAKKDSKIIADSYKIKNSFSENILKEASSIIENKDNFEIKDDRLDLRDLKIITIDSETSKDLDDAISVEKADGVYKVGIHISDVSHFIPLNSPLDLEARSRGNSVYFIDEVYNMFPDMLSNDIFSLNEGVDRFVVSLFVTVNETGDILNTSFHKSVIKSSRRLTYEYANELLIGLKEDEKWLLELLQNAFEAKKILFEKRKDGKGVDFYSKNIKIVLDDYGKPKEFFVEEKKESEKIIEEFMLFANFEAAKKLKDYEGAIYRSHGNPDERTFNNFLILSKIKGYEVIKSSNGNFNLRAFVDSVRGSKDEKLLISLLLKSMRPAIYSVDNKSHFGLGFDYYTYFTSPIRRYVDLINQRLVKTLIHNEIKTDEKEYRKVINDDLKSILKSSAESCSILDKTASKAEKILRQIKAARYMKEKLGDEYHGIISSVSKKGIFVEIEEMGIEGFIDSTYVGGNYRYFEDNQTVYIDKVKGYTLGDCVKVYVAKSDVSKCKIYFSLS